MGKKKRLKAKIEKLTEELEVRWAEKKSYIADHNIAKARILELETEIKAKNTRLEKGSIPILKKQIENLVHENQKLTKDYESLTRDYHHKNYQLNETLQLLTNLQNGQRETAKLAKS